MTPIFLGSREQGHLLRVTGEVVGQEPKESDIVERKELVGRTLKNPWGAEAQGACLHY